MGWLWTLLLNGTLGWGGYRGARAFRLPAGLPTLLGAIVLAWSWLTVGMQLLGISGCLARGPLLIWSGAGAALGHLASRRIAEHRTQGAEAAGREGLSLLGMAALALVLLSAGVWGGRTFAGPVKVVSDGPIYHLYFAARWWKAARLFLVATPFGENAATYFPAGGELWFAWLIIGWGGETLAKLGQAPFLVVAALAAYQLARMFGARPPAAVIATSFFVTSTPLLLFSFEPNVDAIFVAGYLLACVFLGLYALQRRGTSALALAGLAAGCAWGTKPTGHVFIPPLIALGVISVFRNAATKYRPERLDAPAGRATAGRAESPGIPARSGQGVPPDPVTRQRRAATDVAVLLVCSLLPSVFWFGRNVWLSGNPLYPLQVSVFGHRILTGWYGSDMMKRSQYYIPREDWRAFLDVVLGVLDPREAPLWIAAVAGGWSAFGKRSTKISGIWICSLLAVLNVALYWILIPYRTQQRFMFQALGVAVVPLAAMIDANRIARVLALGALALHVFTAQTWPFAPQAAAWDFSPVIPTNFPALLPLTSQTIAATLIPAGLALVSSAFWSVLTQRRGWKRLGLAIVATLPLAAYCILSAPTLPGTRYGPAFFPPDFPDYYRGWVELDLRSGASGVRVAYAGTNLPYYLLGSGMRNDVQYVNIDRHRDWLLHDYHREAVRGGHPNWPGARPGWDRIHPDYAAWLANLRAARIQVLVVCRANPVEGTHNIADPQRFPIERQWAESHPETFLPVYGIAEQDPEFRIYRLRPPQRK